MTACKIKRTLVMVGRCARDPLHDPKQSAILSTNGRRRSTPGLQPHAEPEAGEAMSVASQFAPIGQSGSQGEGYAADSAGTTESGREVAVLSREV